MIEMAVNYKKAGFTFLEIIVSVFVFSILMLITIPLFKDKIRDEQKRSKAINVLYEIKKARLKSQSQDVVLYINLDSLKVYDNQEDDTYRVEFKNGFLKGENIKAVQDNLHLYVGKYKEEICFKHNKEICYE